MNCCLGQKKRKDSQSEERTKNNKIIFQPDSKTNEPQIVGGSKIRQKTAEDKNLKLVKISLSSFQKNAKKVREQNYSLESDKIKHSKLSTANSQFNFKLDSEDGISQTPIINTFHYENITANFFQNSQQKSKFINHQ